ncbi:unnamed protein product [Pleuronectes platessa]|uniref:Uncharacterized protein n=1 Tax=Pleuronectes platessa TaxID=8262 RepID=A0A9N7UJ12_PLEPL|nr:unnamed protein product [Pleuronectes platessa]
MVSLQSSFSSPAQCLLRAGGSRPKSPVWLPSEVTHGARLQPFSKVPAPTRRSSGGRDPLGFRRGGTHGGCSSSSSSRATCVASPLRPSAANAPQARGSAGDVGSGLRSCRDAQLPVLLQVHVESTVSIAQRSRQRCTLLVRAGCQ